MSSQSSKSKLNLTSEKVKAAVQALLQLTKNDARDTKILLEKVADVQLQVSLKKIPPAEKLIHLKLPNAMKYEDLDVCLFVKDLDKEERDYEPTVTHFQDLLRKQGVKCVSEIVPLKSLKTEYKPFEAKRNLSNAYDMFLADARIVRLLPSYLGKFFYGRNRHPVPVNLQSKRLSHEIISAIGNSTCQIGKKGDSSLAKVATVNMSADEITENVLASVTQIAQRVAGGENNIRQLSLKTINSTSIPIYLSAGGPQTIKIEREKKWQEDPEAEEISTLMGAKVKVYSSGRIKVIQDGEEDDKANSKPERYSKRKLQLKRKKSKEIWLAKKKSGLKTTKSKTVPSAKKTLAKKEKSKKAAPSLKNPAKKRKLAS